MRQKRSFQIALGGIICALSLVVLMMTGFIPFATYSLPCIAGLLLVIIVVECGAKWAWICYAATALLALIVTPDREAAIMYIALFGYYPMVKQLLERRFSHSRGLEWSCKLLLFNAAVITAYWAAIHLLGMGYLMEELGEFGKYSLLATLALGNVVFVLYDIAMTRLLSFYLFFLRKKLFKRFK